MSEERNLLAACLHSREAFSKVEGHIVEGDIGEQGRIVLEHIAEYYDTDADAPHADAEIVGRSIERSMSNPKHAVMFKDIVADLDGMDVSALNVVRDVIGVKRQAAGAKLATALAAGRSVSDVQPLIGQYEELASAETLTEQEGESVLCGASVADLVRTSYEGNLIEIWPRALNDRLDGGLLRGHHVVLFARPEAGKTLALINMIAGFLHQNLRVLYVGNEDPIQDIVIRTVSRLTEMNKHEIFADPDTADTIARTRGYDQLILASLAPGTPREIEALIQQYEPDVVLVDQLRNIQVGEDQFVQKLEKAATAMRNLGKRHDVLMVSVTQAGDSASGKAILDMGDVDSSNTGIPATADVMVGIGGTEDDFARDRRVFSLPKNKRSGVHDCFPVQLVRELSKIRGVN